MKRILSLLCVLVLTGCSTVLFPYKDHSLDDLQNLEKSPAAYRGQIVAFGGEVKIITEDTAQVRLGLKIAVPLYYAAAEKRALSYELLLVTFDKQGITRMTGIKKGARLNVLARVDGYETQRNLIGAEVRVLHLEAIALADRSQEKDFVRPELSAQALYDSWKNGRVFYKEQPQDVEKKSRR